MKDTTNFEGLENYTPDKINVSNISENMSTSTFGTKENTSNNTESPKEAYYDIAGAMEKNRELFRKNFVGTPLEASAKKPDTSSTSNLKGPESYEKSWEEYLQEHPEHAVFKGILDKLAKKESAFKNVQNYAGAPAYGYFQLWKTNIGSHTPQEFLNNPKVQIKQAIQLLQNNIRTFTDEDWKKGEESGYGIDSMLAGAWLGGVGGVRNFLHRNINANDGKYYADGKGESVGARMMSFRNKMGGSLDKDYFPIKVSNKTYYVTTAESEKEKTDGLSGIKELPKDEGMLFILDDKDKDSEGLIYFTMEDTEVSLDIVFIDNNFEVTGVFKGEPFSKKPIYGNGDYVLEVNADSGISPGDDLEFVVSKAVNNKMMVLDVEGNAQMTLDGGERIFSIKNTKTLIKFAKKSTATKKDNDYKALGKRVFKFLETQDNNEPEFV